MATTAAARTGSRDSARLRADEEAFVDLRPLSQKRSFIHRLDVCVIQQSFNGSTPPPSLLLIGESLETTHFRGLKECRIFMVGPKGFESETEKLIRLVRDAFFSKQESVECDAIPYGELMDCAARSPVNQLASPGHLYSLTLQEGVTQIIYEPFTKQVVELVILNAEEMSDAELEKIGNFESLETLTIKYLGFEAIPASWGNLSKLRAIHLDCCPNLASGLEFIPAAAAKTFKECPLLKATT